jgi:hypothetical protein
MKAYKKLMKPAGADGVDSASDGKVSKLSDSVRSKHEPDNYQSDSSYRSSSSSSSSE